MGNRGNQGGGHNGPRPAGHHEGPRAAGPNAGGNQQGNRATEIKKMITEQLKDPGKDFFSTCASDFATIIHDEGGQRKNKSSQIRRFFEELILWDERCEESDELCQERLPFIRLMCAKSAYSKGRDLISPSFHEVFTHLVQKIDDYKTLKNARLFMEATIGFRRALEG
jgi:CRISPR-associated protein Csm2